MPKVKLEVDSAKLQAALNQAEDGQTFSKLSDLWEAAATIYNQTPGITSAISASVVYLRAREFNLQYKTEPAKKRMSGAHKDAMAVARAAARIPRGDKFSASQMADNALSAIEARFKHITSMPSGIRTRIKSLKRGSRKAAMELFCIECMGGTISEVGRCTSPGCSLYLFRPNLKLDESGETVLEEESVEDEELVAV
jgi:hypothetical protein